MKQKVSFPTGPTQWIAIMSQLLATEPLLRSAPFRSSFPKISTDCPTNIMGSYFPLHCNDELQSYRLPIVFI